MRTLAMFLVIMVGSALVCCVKDASEGLWGGVVGELVGSLAGTATFVLMRRGRLELAAHVMSGISFIALAFMASSKGGLVATELPWQCAAIVFAVLVIGPRAASVWTGIASLGVVYYALTFDPSWVHGPEVSLRSPLGYAFELVLLYWAVWAFAFAFHRARAEYEARLAKRNDEMHRVLEHARDGLLTIDVTGAVGSERSTQTNAWLGNDATGKKLWDLLRGDDPNAAAWLELAWESVLDEFLPRDVALEQMPPRVKLRGRTLELAVTLIEERGKVAGALVVLHDVTNDLARERAEVGRRDVLALFEQIRKDADAVSSFMEEMARLVSMVEASAGTASALREVHTIKGSASLFGVESLATLCHEIEERAARDGGVVALSDVALLSKRWLELATELHGWTVENDRKEWVQVRRAEIERLRTTALTYVSHREMASQIEALMLMPVDTLLARLARQGTSLASRLGKDVDVVVEPTSLRVDGDVFGPIIGTLAHAIRNALDHGIELPEHRIACGKNERGELRLSARSTATSIILEIADDGRGIDWDLVRAKAKRRASSDDLTALLFEDGFSTRDTVTAVSGRGVGLAAVRAAVQDAGGRVAICSELGEGTRLVIEIPHQAAPAEAFPLSA